jgi:biopolymer transport protein ExbD
MTIGQFSSQDPAEPISEINTTPFVDVMLVLLIIFIVTAPLMTQGLSLRLPEADAPTLPSDAPTIRIDLNAEGEILMDGVALDKGQEALRTTLADKARISPTAQVQIRADGATPYARIAEVISLAQAEGLTQIALVTATPATPSTPSTSPAAPTAPTASSKTPTPGDARRDLTPQSRPPR